MKVKVKQWETFFPDAVSIINCMYYGISTLSSRSLMLQSQDCFALVRSVFPSVLPSVIICSCWCPICRMICLEYDVFFILIVFRRASFGGLANPTYGERLPYVHITSASRRDIRCPLWCESKSRIRTSICRISVSLAMWGGILSNCIILASCWQNTGLAISIRLPISVLWSKVGLLLTSRHR